MSFFNPQLNSPDEKERKRAISKTKDILVLINYLQAETNPELQREAALKFQKMLPEVAKSHENPEMRIAAINQIDDTALLVSILKAEKDMNVARAAISKIRYLSDSVLEVAKKAKTKEVCIEAVSCISDEEALVGIAVKHKLPGVRFFAYCKIESNEKRPRLQKIISEKELVGFALNDTDARIRRHAVAGISDLSTLQKVALHDSDRHIRWNALKKISDQRVIKQILQQDTDDEVRELAVSKLDDQASLLQVLQQDKSPRVRRQAVLGVKDDSVLKKIVQTDSDVHVRAGALKHITDQEFLFAVSQNDADSYIRQQVVYSISDPKLLTQIMHIEVDDFIRNRAAHQISDTSVLLDLAKNGSSFGVRKSALLAYTNPGNETATSILSEKINDEDILKDIVANDKNSFARSEAAKKIKDYDFLVSIVKTANDNNLIKTICPSIKDDEVLKNLAVNSKSPDIRKLALSLIKDESTRISIGLADSDAQLRQQAIEKTKDTDVLADIAMKEPNAQNRGLCIQKLSDKDILHQLAENESHPANMQLILQNKLHDKTIQLLIEKHFLVDDEEDDESDYDVDYSIDYSLYITMPEALNKISSEDMIVDLLKKIAIADYDMEDYANVLPKITSQKNLHSIAMHTHPEGPGCPSVWLRDYALSKLTDTALLDDIAENADNESTRWEALVANVNNKASEKTVEILFKMLKKEKNSTNEFYGNETRGMIEDLFDKLLQNQPKVLLNSWSDIHSLVSGSRHRDTEKHQDNGEQSKSSDCDYHDDITTHIDSGYALDFPATPPKL